MSTCNKSPYLSVTVCMSVCSCEGETEREKRRGNKSREVEGINIFQDNTILLEHFTKCSVL